MKKMARCLPGACLGGTVAALAFGAAMLCYPGGDYSPCRRMLSALGRTVVRDVEWPWSCWFFLAGMVASIGAVARVWIGLEVPTQNARRRIVARMGKIANVLGLCIIACVPENVNGLVHNLGCWLAATGGGAVLWAVDRPGLARRWTIALAVLGTLFAEAVRLHGCGTLPFAPWTPTLQKCVIVAFAAWILHLSRRQEKSGGRWGLASLALAFAWLLFAAWWPQTAKVPFVPAPERTARALPPLTVDERAALCWLDHVTGPLAPAEEKEWWSFGGRQFEISSKRYHIAFAGYAAAALGQRANPMERQVVVRILGNCLHRLLARDVWAYSQSKKYWGAKPWAPNPCYRENVMYTGHLLHLLALYETYSGDRRYWTEGFDFVWDATHRVHMDVRQLIDVTVEQMRKGPNGGVCCEPGLMFFPCNSHPHVAFRLFARLGHGDWTADARRWESWAVPRYTRPLFGGGQFNVVYHVRSNIFYPRGVPGMDGWSLLWYEAWAERRGTAVALWRAAADRIDWTRFDAPNCQARGKFTCCDPADVPDAVSAVFLAAAARACDDPETAKRLEDAVDRACLVREKDVYRLELDRTWRIGASAMRIIALAESNGSHFR